MRTSKDEGTIEQVTAALIAFCPDKKTREGLWSQYTELIKGDAGGSIGGSSTVTASVMVVGALIDYLNDTLEFTEKSTGGFL